MIEGRKTMTRRLIPDEFFGLTWDTRGNTLVYENEYGDFIDVRLSKYTRYKVGEIVAVAQNYFSTYDESKWENGIWYNEFADGSDITNHAGWLNKMLVKAEYMPHQIRITGIHCERLQDISDAECLKEGVRVEFARNGSPIREKMVLKFDTKEEAERVKIGTIAKDKTLYELLK